MRGLETRDEPRWSDEVLFVCYLASITFSRNASNRVLCLCEREPPLCSYVTRHDNETIPTRLAEALPMLLVKL
jgi:hypothetical protein